MGATWSDERLLEWVLDPDGQSDAERAEVAADPALARRAAELGSFLATCRETLSQPERDARAASRLTQRILARTTREDLSWRGDLTLIAGFVGSRLRTSGWLKLAAASLLLHVAGAPILAYYLWIKPQPEPIIRFEMPPEIIYDADVSEPEREVRVDELPETPDGAHSGDDR